MNPKPGDPPRVAVVIPAYLAENSIRKVIAEIPASVSHIIVVNDASPDATMKMLRESSDGRLTVLSHDRNQGVGGAVLTGYSKALEFGVDIIVKMDADGQMDARYLPELILPIWKGEADYAKGNRFLHTRALTHMPCIRRIGNTGLSFLTKLASGYWHIFDPTNGYTAIHAFVLSFLRPSNIDRRYFFETSMLIELGVARAVVKDVYIPAKYADQASSLSEIHSLLIFPWKLAQGFFRRIAVQYFVRDFTTVSMLLSVGLPSVAFGLAFGVYHWVSSAANGIPTNTGTVMISVLPVILGVQFILQALALDIQNAPSTPLQLSAALPSYRDMPKDQ